MSTSEQEVSEAIAETDSFDMDAAVEELAKDIFPTSQEKDLGYNPDEYEVVEEKADEDKGDEEVLEETEEGARSEPEASEEKEEEKELKAIPQSWKKDMQDRWDGLDSETQDYIELREKQMKEGVDVRKDDADLGMRMRDAFSPFENVLKQNKIDPVSAAQRMMATHLRIASASPEQKKQLFDQLAQSYGITNDPVDDETQKLMNNPTVQNLVNKVNQLEQNVNVSQQASQQERETQINSKVENFAAEHPYFDDLSDDIARLIRADYSLEDAYDMAFNNSPYMKKELEKEREDKEKEDEKAKKKEAEKAKKAKSVNVRGRDTSKAPTAPIGTMDDTMRETMREIRNRN